ncbi:hypothetical protein H0H92_010650 [Tricholoma furcatifolium]|nr:hypothetical protein H0H92_010650 [Tricholoma furcatifolium]
MSHASSSQSTWHSIRPWKPPLTLSVREVTSVSVTFILSSNWVDVNGELEPLAGLIAGEEDQANDQDHSQTIESKKKSIISDALAKGLSVDVNGSPWQRVFIRIEEGADEAVIIIYGLMPGREYDVQLGLVQGDSSSTIRQQVTTEEEFEHESSEPTDVDSPDVDHSTSSSEPPVSTPSTSPSRTHPNTPPSTTVPLTLEDRLNQLQHTLSVVNTEREALATALKAARRDAQKADAAIRSEIETLKRASEKHVAADNRAKQKILSLQEAVKRAQTATREAEELVEEMEALQPELSRQRQEKEAEYVKMKEQVDRVQKERDRQAEKDKKKLETMKNELAGLTSKMEKLNAKKEKLETVTIAELELQLQDIEREIERAEKDAQAQLTYAMFMDRTDLLADDPYFRGADGLSERSPAFPYLSSQRGRTQQSTVPGPIGPVRRPLLPPIQRPSPNDTNNNSTSRQTLSTHTHTPRSSSLQHPQTPILLTNPNRHLSKSANSSPSNSISSSSPSLNHSNLPSSAASTSTSSTLSSRAPAFEPGRHLKNSIDNGSTSALSALPIPIQRPGGTGMRTSGSTKTKQGSWLSARNS